MAGMVKSSVSVSVRVGCWIRCCCRPGCAGVARAANGGQRWPTSTPPRTFEPSAEAGPGPPEITAQPSNGPVDTESCGHRVLRVLRSVEGLQNKITRWPSHVTPSLNGDGLVHHFPRRNGWHVRCSPRPLALRREEGYAWPRNPFLCGV